jgi:hypothetical protein
MISDDAMVTVILGRDGLGPNATEQDFDAWVAYASQRVGLDHRLCHVVKVEARGSRGVQSDFYIGEQETVDEARAAVRAAWDQWCAEGVQP